MLVRVLGEVALLAPGGEAVPLQGARQAALLAALAARAGQVVGAERLADLLWSEEPPANPAAALHSAVFKLRTQLRTVGGRDVLLTRDRGYQLALEPGDLDATEFTSLVDRARDEPPAEAASTLTRALDLWRGAAYAGHADTPVAQLEAIRLEELRRVATERLGAALLGAGRAADAVALLQAFVAEHPVRESARATLMEALQAVGRTPDALEHYQEYRRHLADELGLEPSPWLQSLHVELLQPVGVAAAPAPASPAAPGDTPAPGPTGTAEPVVRGLPGMPITYVRTDSGRLIAHGTTGTGPPVVVLLGWISSLEVIASGRDPRSSLLERLTGDLTLTLFDRGGSGLSPGPITDYGLEASVAELTAVVREVGPPVSVMAMSSSGPIALTLAHRRPEWVDSLVLFGTFANGPATFRDVGLREMVVRIAREHWGIGSKMLADLYRPGISDEAAWHLAKVFRDSASPEVAASYLEHMYDQDVTDLLPAIAAPALVLHYRRDRLIGFRGGQELAAGLPHSTFLPLEGRVHLPDARDLDQMQRAITEHVRRHASR